MDLLENATNYNESVEDEFEEALFFDVNYTLFNVVDEYLAREQQSKLISPIVLLTISLLGVFFNALNIAVYSRATMRSPINMLLLAFEAANIVFFATFIMQGFEYFMPYSFFYTPLYIVYKKLYPYLRLSTSSFSNWLAVTIGLWRCIAVGLPIKAAFLLSNTRAKLGIAFLCIASFLITIPGLLLTTYNREIIPFYDDNWVVVRNYTLYIVVQAAERYRDIFFVYIIITLIITVLPCAILMLATAYLIFSLQRASRLRHKMQNVVETQSQIRDRKLTLMLLVVLITFVLSYLPDGICVCILINFFEDFMSKTTGWDKNGFCKKSILDGLFPLITNGITFFIYLAMSENFRQAAKETFACFALSKLVFKRSHGNQSSTNTDISISPSNEVKL